MRGKMRQLPDLCLQSVTEQGSRKSR